MSPTLLVDAGFARSAGVITLAPATRQDKTRQDKARQDKTRHAHVGTHRRFNVEVRSKQKGNSNANRASIRSNSAATRTTLVAVFCFIVVAVF
eukprot:COSAG06_NODE_31165_length_526_cov_0.665105_1_plen_93_part_01